MRIGLFVSTLALLAGCPAFAQVADNDLAKMHDVCEMHKTNFAKPSQAFAKPYQDKWERCLDIEVEYQKRQADKINQDEAANPDLKSLNDTAKALNAH